MFLQGNLQTVFDALYHLGIIDPVLDMDWSEALDEMPQHYAGFAEVMTVVNQCPDDVQRLMTELEHFDQTALGYLAMEVAREFADFHSREELH